ncbi:hypothetical protein D3C72_1960310 [compost metagenome]
MLQRLEADRNPVLLRSPLDGRIGSRDHYIPNPTVEFSLPGGPMLLLLGTLVEVCRF